MKYLTFKDSLQYSYRETIRRKIIFYTSQHCLAQNLLIEFFFHSFNTSPGLPRYVKLSDTVVFLVKEPQSHENIPVRGLSGA